MKKAIRFGSLCVHDQPDQPNTKPHQIPIYATSSFEFENIDQGMAIFTKKEEGHVYGRYGNPTIDAVQKKLAALECHGLDIEAHGLMHSSGMSAISTMILSVMKMGDKILTQGNIYGGTSELFLKTFAPFGIETVMCDLKNLNEVEAHLKKDASIKMVYFETPANPTLACVDMQALSDLAHQYDAYAAADNTFSTAYLQQPLKYGVDFVIHSTTKYINGHGNSIAGALIGRDVELMKGKVWQTMKLAGTNCNPWDAWLTNNGMKTLALRMEKHSSNAQAIAEFLEKSEKVKKVNYVGLPDHEDHAMAKKQMKNYGGMLSFELKAGLDAGIQFMNKIKFCTLAPTLGDVDTLILHPASMSHINIDKAVREANGITDGLIRISTGIEEVEDILEDLSSALD